MTPSFKTIADLNGAFAPSVTEPSTADGNTPLFFETSENLQKIADYLGESARAVIPKLTVTDSGKATLESLQISEEANVQAQAATARDKLTGLVPEEMKDDKPKNSFSANLMRFMVRRIPAAGIALTG